MSASHASLLFKDTPTGVQLYSESRQLVVGHFLRPEFDEVTVDDHPFSRVRKTVLPAFSQIIWRADAGFEVIQDLRIAGNRVEVNIRVTGEIDSSNLPYIYFPFIVSRPLDTPRLVSFTRENGEPMPIDCLMPGEGLTAWWGDRKYNQAITDIQMVLPVVGFNTEHGVIVAGCAESEHQAFIVHRDGRVEIARRFYGGSERDSRQTSYFIAWESVLDWQTLYRKYLITTDESEPVQYSYNGNQADLLLIRLSAGKRIVRLLPPEVKKTFLSNELIKDLLFFGCLPADCISVEKQLLLTLERLSVSSVVGGPDPLRRLEFLNPDSGYAVTLRNFSSSPREFHVIVKDLSGFKPRQDIFYQVVSVNSSGARRVLDHSLPAGRLASKRYSVTLDPSGTAALEFLPALR